MKDDPQKLLIDVLIKSGAFDKLVEETEDRLRQISIAAATAAYNKTKELYGITDESEPMPVKAALIQLGALARTFGAIKYACAKSLHENPGFWELVREADSMAERYREDLKNEGIEEPARAADDDSN